MSKYVKYLKFVGLLNLTLHELILCEKIEVIEKRIKCLSSGRKSQPELLNQYDDNGKEHVMIIVSFFSVLFISTVSFFLFLIRNLSLFLYMCKHEYTQKKFFFCVFSGHTPLSISVKVRRRDIVSALLGAGASPDIYDERTGR